MINDASSVDDSSDAAKRVEGRSDLLPEEVHVGSDDPKAQAAVILEDSDERTEHPEVGARESSQSATHVQDTY